MIKSQGASPAVPAADSPRLTSFLLKVASRCNLACDYCYMYEHADQTWREQPHVMDTHVRDSIARRIGEYAGYAQLARLAVILHGGEPLLCGIPFLTDTAHRIRSEVRAQAGRHVVVDIGVQTNGVLLDDSALGQLADAAIGISLSLDGPAQVNDRHRPLAGGRSSSEATLAALERLRRRPDIFRGVIAVIDADNSPEDLLSWFADQEIPGLDLLLPDANHQLPPLGRGRDPDRYARWLTRAFDAWFDNHPTLPLRTFDALVAAILGAPSDTDAFGLGNVSLLTIETDGTYHDLDVLKITEPGMTSLGLYVGDHPIRLAASSPGLLAHQELLSPAGLAQQCQVCPELTTCGGGAVPHRWDGHGFDKPSIYCHELLTLITHIRSRLTTVIGEENVRWSMRGDSRRVDIATFARSDGYNPARDALVRSWRAEATRRLTEVLADNGPEGEALLHRQASELGRIACRPGPSLWLHSLEAAAAGQPLQSLDGSSLDGSIDYLQSLNEQAALSPEQFSVHRDDPMLRAAFGDPIRFLTQEEAGNFLDIIDDALLLVQHYSSDLYNEMLVLSPEIQLVVDTSAHPDKVVSFSDDAVPGCLYIYPGGQGGSIDRFDLAESLIHEHRHQKLYLLQREVRLLNADQPLVPSPWRAEPRPPSGVLHAAWVFAELIHFWSWVAEMHTRHRERARSELTSSINRLDEAWTILDGVALSPAGQRLVDVLRRRVGELGLSGR